MDSTQHQVTEASHRDGRRGLLIDARRYLAYARCDPDKAAHFLAWRKFKQRQLAVLRKAVRISTLGSRNLGWDRPLTLP